MIMMLHVDENQPQPSIGHLEMDFQCRHADYSYSGTEGPLFEPPSSSVCYFTYSKFKQGNTFLLSSTKGIVWQ